MGFRRADTTAEPWAGPQFEYRIEKLDVERLNELGAQGWEAVANVGSGMGANVRVLMKRERS